MFLNYLISACRNLRRRPSAAIINVIGLSLAVGWNLLVQQFVAHELTYDRFHERIDRTYRVVTERSGGGRSPQIMDLDIGRKLAAQYPGIRGVVRTRGTKEYIRSGDDFVRERILFADPSLLDVFTFPLLAGDPGTALDNAIAAVITRRAALRHFGTTDVVGRQLVVATQEWASDERGFSWPQYVPHAPFVVAGVLEDIPTNSSLVFDILLPYEAASGIAVWGIPHLFLELKEGVDGGDFPSGFPAFVRSEMGTDPASLRLLLQPFEDIHFDQGTRYQMLARTGDPVFLWAFSSIGLLILAVACLNYGNLTIARVAGRAREIGVRKAIGARRGQLIVQFLGEAAVATLAALALGLGLAELGLPLLRELAGSGPGFSYQDVFRLDVLSPAFLVGALCVAALTGTIAGVVPALVLANLRASRVLARRQAMGTRSSLSRGLVALQFALSAFLVVSAVAMYRQVDFMKSKDLGFDADQVVALNVSHDRPGEALALLRNELLRHPEIVEVAGAYPAPGGMGSAPLRWEPPGKSAEVRVARYWSDSRFVRAMGMSIVAGTDFDVVDETSDRVLVNETLAVMLDGEDVIGRVLPGLGARENTDAIVAGVVRDFHNHRLHNAISPAVIYPHPGGGSIQYALIRLRAGDVSGGIRVVRETWEGLAPNASLRYEFFDEQFAQWYHAEERMSRMLRYAGGLAVFIGCLGLYGLAEITATRRTKEIGIRKAVGAGADRIAALVSREFVGLAAAGNLVAAPITYLVMQRWLQSFAYRAELEVWTFVGAGIATLCLALLSVGYQTLRVALTNPVEALRDE